MKTSNIVYRYAVQEDLSSICKFVDYWLSGKAKDEGVKGGVSDHFVPRGQQIDYLKFYTVLLAMNDDEVLAWAVMTNQGILIHLLVSGDYRNKGIGKNMLNILKPKSIRSKTDQSSTGYTTRHRRRYSLA